MASLQPLVLVYVVCVIILHFILRELQHLWRAFKSRNDRQDLIYMSMPLLPMESEYGGMCFKDGFQDLPNLSFIARYGMGHALSDPDPPASHGFW